MWGILAQPDRHFRETRRRRHRHCPPALRRSLEPHARAQYSVGRREARHHRAERFQTACSRPNPESILPARPANWVPVVPYQMQAGDEKVVADRLYGVLSKPPKKPAPAAPARSPFHVAGVWELKLDFVYGSANHKSSSNRTTPPGRVARGEFASGDLTGTVAGNRLRFQSSLPTEGQRVSFQFEGTEQGGKLAGTVLLGEYGDARWTAERHTYRTGGRRG